MTPQTAVASESAAPAPSWSASAPHVRKAIAFIKRRGTVSADELVEFDRTHGRRLFDWNDPAAAEDWRKHQARLFLNSFRAKFEGMRVRAFVHIHEDADAAIESAGYVSVETIAQHPGMRAQVMADIVKRMKTLASELKMWKLSDDEQRSLFTQLADAMRGAEREAA